MSINRFSLRQLQVFAAVARNESVSRAAVELSLSQSAVSGALAELERQFGVELFDRVGKRVQLSELGRTLRPRAEALLEQASLLERELVHQAEGGSLRVGATLTIGNYVAVPLVAALMVERPGARVTLEVANTSTVAHKVQNFEIDMGLVEGELSRAELEVTPWQDDRLCVFARAGHPLARRRTVDDDALRAAPWIVRETGSGTRQAFERAMHGLLPELRVVLELQHTEAIKGAVAAGLGVGCVSRIALEEDFRRGTLVPLDVPQRNFERQFYFVVHRAKYRSPTLARFIELCRASVPAGGANIGDRRRRTPREPGRRRAVST